jgi:hypothetical protein
MSSPAANSLEERMIKEATAHVQSAEIAARKGCQEALLAGMRLIWLHQNTSAQGSRNDIVPRGTKSGFEGALEKIGLPKRTAYRWINATYAAAERIGILQGSFPEPGTPNWKGLENGLSNVAAGMSLRRLVIGCSAPNSDDQRQDELITRAEAGDLNAEHVLELISAGKLTLVQAMRAAAGALATKGKERKDPVYLDFDVESKTATGLIPKAFITLQNGFKGWDDYSPAAKTALRNEWHATRQAMPDDLFTSKK